MIPKFIQFKGVYDYFVLCKMYGIVCERKHGNFTLEMYNQINKNKMKKIESFLLLKHDVYFNPCGFIYKQMYVNMKQDPE